MFWFRNEKINVLVRKKGLMLSADNFCKQFGILGIDQDLQNVVPDLNPNC